MKLNESNIRECVKKVITEMASVADEYHVDYDQVKKECQLCYDAVSRFNEFLSGKEGSDERGLRSTLDLKSMWEQDDIARIGERDLVYASTEAINANYKLLSALEDMFETLDEIENAKKYYQN